MTSANPIGGSRYEVRRRIGTGSSGIVYEVFDPVRNKVLALKALRQTTPDALYRFKREFRSLSDMAERNLVRLYDLVSEGDQWFVSMELIRGRNFIEYVRGAPFTPAAEEEQRPAADTLPGTADPARLALALPQLATGLIALHNAGKLHRDIKPSNVLVAAEDQRVVLLDFGLVLDTDVLSSMAATEGTSGTPAYMSPEQCGGEPLGPASDWYSVGVMLYEALTGRVPFRGGSYVDVLNFKRAGDVPPPSAIVAGIPQHLDDLCRDLLRRDPRARPTADEILQRLGSWAPPRISPPKREAVPLVGRERHLRTLREAFNAAVDGVQTTICVQGASGAGKTALVRAFLEEQRQEVPDLLVLTGRCYQRESVPYKGVDSLVDALHRYLSRLDPSAIDALLPRDIAAAEQLFPVLRDLCDLMRFRRRVVPAIDTANQHDLRQRAFAAMRELLFRLAERTKLVLVIDDLQWGDVDSAELLDEVLRPPDAPPLLFIAAYRSDTTETPFVRAFRERVRARDLVLDPLTPEESCRFALQLLGDSVNDPAEVARLIADESGGSPFFIGELVRAFTMAGPTVLRRDATILEVLQVRLRRLDPPALGLLQMISVHGRPILRAPLHRALSGGEFEKTLTTLAAQHLIRTRETVDGEAVEPYHDRIAEAAVAMLNEEERRQRHAQLAAALEKFEADAELLADHLLAAGLPDRAAVYVERAAENAAAALAFDRAARLFRRAITLNPANAPALQRRLDEMMETGE